MKRKIWGAQMDRVLERDLLEPAVEIIAKFGDPDHGLAISEMAPLLRNRFTPSAQDLEQLRNRLDDRLSQIIRNLVSHRTLEKEGLAVFVKENGAHRGRYVLTPYGWDIVRKQAA